AAVAGDQRAIGVLFEVLHPRLSRYLGLMVGRDAEDVASDTWIEVMRSLPRFVGGADTIGAWVVGIGRNRALTHFRRAQSRPRVVADTGVFADVLAADSDTYGSVEEAMGTADAPRPDRLAAPRAGRGGLPALGGRAGRDQYGRCPG